MRGGWAERVGQQWLQALRDPRGVLRRKVGRMRARLLFPSRQGGEKLCATGYVRAELGGDARFGAHVIFEGGMIPTEVLVSPGATLSIADGCHFNYGCSIKASSSIRVGKRCLFGALVRISDASNGRVAPVVVGDDVWVAHGAIIEPGVEIGAGAVISAGSVVLGNVPPGAMVAGNPARVVGRATGTR